uniref:Uncharacterized protein n=1 Tax=Melopsittacus undulatus TaxID=13146 RepID=A0A8C6NCN8_MELUD
MAAAMGIMDDEDLLDYFRMEYSRNLLHLQSAPGLVSPLGRYRLPVLLSDPALSSYASLSLRVCWWGKHHQEDDKMQVQALKKATRKREEKVQKEFELLTANRELEVWRNKHEKLYNTVQKYSIFRRYLEDVVKISQFVDTQEVISHYKMLLRLHKDLEQSQERHKEKSEQGSVFLDQYIAEKEAEILQCKHKLLELQQHFDQAKEDAQLWETRWADIQKTSSKKALELGTIRMAILNLFQSADREMNTKLNVPVDDSHRQLNMV